MTEKDKISPKHHGHFTYSGEFREYELVTLGFYLQGKPDTPGWRRTFAFNETTLVEHNGRIFPEWAVLDARQLFQEEPRTVEKVLKQYGLSQEDIPPLQ